jgi:hypothetical protein
MFAVAGDRMLSVLEDRQLAGSGNPNMHPGERELWLGQSRLRYCLANNELLDVVSGNDCLCQYRHIRTAESARISLRRVTNLLVLWSRRESRLR